jgi:hypothetical protein
MIYQRMDWRVFDIITLYAMMINTPNAAASTYSQLAPTRLSYEFPSCQQLF